MDERRKEAIEKYQEAVRKYFREDRDFTRGSLWVIFGSAFVVFVLSALLTQPWPRRGTGGGYGTNMWGPLVTVFAPVVTVVILAKLLHRGDPPTPPRL